jgi:hypothetical protein
MINPRDFAAGEMQKNLDQLRDFEGNPEHLNEQIKTYFDAFDSDENDCLDRKELRLFLTQFFGTYHIRAPITDEYVDAIFREIDSNRDNKIQLIELQNFAALFVRKLCKLFQAAIDAGEGNVALADQSPATVPAAYQEEEEKKD